MALPSITTADFTGDIKLSQNSFRSVDLTAYINLYYPLILAGLIGEAAVQEIEDTTPLPTKYTDLLQGTGTYNNTEMDADLKKPELVEYVKRVIYFNWLRDGNDINTPAGQASNAAENATMLNRNQIGASAKERFNWAMYYFNLRAVPFLENYCDYESAISSVADLGGGVLQINTSDTIYLQDGDTVTIGGAEYTVSNLIDDASFDITASFATTPTSYTYSPYAILIYKQQNPVLF